MTTNPLLPDPAAVRAACAGVADPEFGVGIGDLGLIYDVTVTGADVAVAMTLTTMSCPAGAVIVDAVRASVAAVPGVMRVDVRLVWDPAWTPEMISDRGRELLGWRQG
ncbi:MAG: metal-sulfur cluster assembly factor [Opitutaceae bacterium]|nr:metal-sulfur cluster assembly factor [Opitutaceae bacterium]